MGRHAGLIGIFLALAFTSPLNAQTKIEWNFKQGDTFYLQSVTQTKQEMKALGKEMKLDMEQDFLLGFKVEKKEADGTVILKETVEDLVIKSPTGSSQADEKLKNAVFTITLNPRMEITKFEGYDAFIKRLAGANAEDEKRIRSIITEETMKQSVKLAITVFLPLEPKKPADVWDKTTEVPLGPLGVMESKNSYKYDGKGKLGDREYDKISFISSIKYRLPKEDTANAPYQVVKAELKAEDAKKEGPKGVIYFDTAEGHLVEMQTTLPLRGTMTLSSLGQQVDAEIKEQIMTTRIVYSKTNPKQASKPADTKK